jgi:enoyl-CoA hydratase
LDYSKYQDLIVEIDEQGVALVTINRPEALNATNNRLHTDLVHIWGDLDRDPAVRVIVVTGAGERAFSAGGDLNDLEARSRLPSEERFEEVIQILDEAQQLVYAIVNCSKIVVSAINGVAVGAGLAVALMADISIMAEEARITDGHLRLGVAAGDHAAMIWPLLCGMAKAKYYLLTSEFVDGREAERIGLVSIALPRAEVLPRALKVAHDLANGPQVALRFTKRSLNQWLRFGGLVSFDYSAALEIMGFFSGDPAAGIKGIVERRPAQFPSAR